MMMMMDASGVADGEDCDAGDDGDDEGTTLNNTYRCSNSPKWVGKVEKGQHHLGEGVFMCFKWSEMSQLIWKGVKRVEKVVEVVEEEDSRSGDVK